MEFEVIKNALVEQFSVNEDEITLETSLLEDLGADSLDLVELIMAMEQEFDIEIPDEDVEQLRTVGDAVNYIKEKVQG